MARFSRWEKVAGALLVLATAVTARACGQKPQRFVNADTDVVTPSLQSLADTATREYGRCLYGTVMGDANGDSLYSIDLATPPVAETRPANRPNTGITFGCFADNLIAIWHNHVLAEWKKLPQGPWSWSEAPTPAAEACQLSTGDLISAIKPTAPPITAISVDRYTFCWWFRDELRVRYLGKGDLPVAVRPDAARLRTDWGKP